MQIIVTDKDFYKSASNLTRQNLQSQIFEAIHVLACNLGVEDKLINPIAGKRSKSIKNHPVSKLWKGLNLTLYGYILIHIQEWKFNRKYYCDTSERNYNILFKGLKDCGYFSDKPHMVEDKSFITDDFIQMHRSNLIRKEIERENKLKKDALTISCMYLNGNFNRDIYEKKCNDLTKKLSFHYRDLWPDCPVDIPMRYDF